MAPQTELPPAMGAHCAPGVFGIVSIMGGGAGHTGQAHGPQHPRDWQGVGCLYAAANTPRALPWNACHRAALDLAVEDSPWDHHDLPILRRMRLTAPKPNIKPPFQMRSSDARRFRFLPTRSNDSGSAHYIAFRRTRVAGGSAASHRHSLPPPRYPPHKFRTHNHQSRSRPHINKLQSGFPALLIPSPICRLDQRHRRTGAPDVCCNPVSTACGHKLYAIHGPLHAVTPLLPRLIKGRAAAQAP